MIKKIIDIIWILVNTYIIYASVVSAYHNFMIGDTSRAILLTVAIVGFIILTIFLIIKDVVPDFKKVKPIEKRGKGERRMTCEYCVHVENCLSTGRIREEEVGEDGCCNEFEYGGLLEHDEEGKEE